MQRLLHNIFKNSVYIIIAAEMVSLVDSSNIILRFRIKYRFKKELFDRSLRPYSVLNHDISHLFIVYL